jgi:hypothetical protein
LIIRQIAKLIGADILSRQIGGRGTVSGEFLHNRSRHSYALAKLPQRLPTLVMTLTKG